ncbi:GW dipeptide domain-containing protein [Lutibacter sp.]|uniref:GW dipeptide domain-containing protein n=1 Tax=Lutibacter sp. TaxID=1925666 RepID=UPI001A18BDB4|nr:GW dipeptide domain-containing protein [Lutibacter sp.]MBI9042690.1 SH3-like domain-containing protein [Lutibacter sp.]
MILKIKSTVLILLLIMSTIACNNGPKVIESSNEATSSEKSSGIFSGENKQEATTTAANTFAGDLHTIKVNEILETSKYLYMNVTENEEQFWIATRLMDITIGETYYYKGGLLKTNYESKDFNRVFEKIYLISGSLVAANHSTTGTGQSNKNELLTKQKTTKATKAPIKTLTNKIEVKGSMKISELVKNAKNLEGKTVQISGACVKSNANIMNRNWIHLKDGSKDDFDLVITSDTFIPEDAIVTLKATVSLNKDFGAGYKYDLILENGTILR